MHTYEAKAREAGQLPCPSHIIATHNTQLVRAAYGPVKGRSGSDRGPRTQSTALRCEVEVARCGVSRRRASLYPTKLSSGAARVSAPNTAALPHERKQMTTPSSVAGVNRWHRGRDGVRPAKGGHLERSCRREVPVEQQKGFCRCPTFLWYAHVPSAEIELILMYSNRSLPWTTPTGLELHASNSVRRHNLLPDSS